MAASDSARSLHFGAFSLDLRALELTKGGTRIRVPEQSLQILAMLLERPGDVVAREDLHAKLWPNGTIVEFEHSINAAMNRLRVALGDSADEPRFIETLPRRGYRFIFPVEPAQHEVVESGLPAEASSGDLTGQTVSHYRVLKKLGQGAMGVVYKAEDLKLGRTVALKFLTEELSDSPQARERFQREARAVSSLNHPHICTLHDIGHQDGMDFLVMEYLEGETLAHRLSKGPLPADQVLHFSIQITAALDAAHRRGVIHRDLKPGNVMLTKSGAKLLDFGLAKMRAAEAVAGMTAMPTQTTPLTGEGTILGTLQYMAPEQLEGQEADARTDIFALGAVIYEMATGRRAFEGKSQASLISAILTAEPPPISMLQTMAPPALDHVVRTCLAKEPDARWQSAHDVLLQLQWIAGAGAVSTTVLTRGRNHARLAWPALAAVAAVIAIVLAFLYFREKPVETQAVRFSVFPPEKADFGDALAISPDGTRLALVVSTPGNGPSLWVRRLDSLAVQPLAGTEGADEPFWSPDGRFIAFFAQGKLRKVDAAGGPPQTLCEAPGGTGGSWNRDGVIIFGLHHVLYRVPAEGGQPTSVTALNETRHEFEHLGPYFLSDDRHFLYLAVGRKRGMSDDGIYIGSLDAKENKRLMDSHWMAAYTLAPGGRDGYVLFVRDGTLMAQRFDLNQLRVTGRPVPLAEDINRDQEAPVYFSVSASGTLAYLPNGLVKTQLVWLDRLGKQLGMVQWEPGQDERPSLSPDGKQVAIERNDLQSGNTNIWRLDLQRGTATRVTFVPAVDRSPVWSPDGNRIVFASYRDGSFNLYQKAASGVGNEELLLKSDEFKVSNDWSRDGRFLIYASVNTKTGYDLWVLPFDGDRKPFPFLQTQFSETAGRLSPDGKWMAYQSNESGRWEVYVQPFVRAPGDGDQALAASAGKWRISTESGVFPCWRRDGKELFYMTQGQGKIRAVTVKTGGSKDRPNFDASVPEPLFDLPPNYGYRPFTVTADGQRFLVNTRVGKEKSTSITVVLNWPSLLKR